MQSMLDIVAKAGLTAALPHNLTTYVQCTYGRPIQTLLYVQQASTVHTENAVIKYFLIHNKYMKAYSINFALPLHTEGEHNFDYLREDH